MSIEELEHIVAGLTRERTEQEDLLQEALIHLWEMECRSPDQTRSWYLQGCRFYLQNFRRRGCSVDSWKHRSIVVPNPVETYLGGFCPGGADLEFMSHVCERDVVGLLAGQLEVRQIQILQYLCDGYSCREIGAKMGVSHSMIVKERRRIAQLAASLGVGPGVQALPKPCC